MITGPVVVRVDKQGAKSMVSDNSADGSGFSSELLDDALELAIKIGEVPSRNRLMKAFGIGADRARSLRAALAAELESELSPTRTMILKSGSEGLAPRGAATGAEQLQTGSEPGSKDHDPALMVGRVNGVDHGLPMISEPTSDPPPDPGSTSTVLVGPKIPKIWPVALLALPAFVAIWSGWVGLGRLTGFGVVDLLPGIAPPGGWATLDTAITLPIGVETYAAYALHIWLRAGGVPARARRFAAWSAAGSLAFGAAGQVAYHLLIASGVTAAPWRITTVVACLPVAVLGMGAALAHLVRAES